MGQEQSSPNEERVVQGTSDESKVPSAPAVSETTGTCPMKRADGNGYLFSWKNPHSSAFLAAKNKNEVNPSPSPVNESTTTQASACPMKKGSSQVQVQYNVYSQPIDPNNNMPAVANQLPAPSQTQSLSTQRISSTIPKGGAADGETWLYPSPQMFYNALTRKNKLGETEEADMNSVVALHNNMNEKTWATILEWEQVMDTNTNPSGSISMDESSESGPKLLKFIGRPSDLSPKARIKHVLFNYPLPFDRHDWTIQRQDGTQARYVIDYYYDESQASHSPDSALPQLHDRHSVKSILVDVRPALDSFTNIFHRLVQMPYARFIAKNTNFEPLPLYPTAALQSQVSDSLTVWEQIQASVANSKKKASVDSTRDEPLSVLETISSSNSQNITESQATEIAKTFALMLQNCRQAQKQVDQCSDDAECAKASLALTLCLGKIICPLQHETVTHIIKQGGDGNKNNKTWDAQMDVALENLATCVQMKSEQGAMAKRLYPSIFGKS